MMAAKTAVAHGAFEASARVRFSDYADAWIGSYAGRTGRGVRAETRADYGRVLERDAKPFFGRMRMCEVTTQDIKLYVSGIEARKVKTRAGLRPVSAGTVRLALAPVRAMFATALEEGVVRRNPCQGVRVSQHSADDGAGDDEVKALTEAELAQVLAATPTQWRDLVDFLSESGLRIGEAVALEYGDIDFGTRQLSVGRRLYRGRIGPPKSRQSRRSSR